MVTTNLSGEWYKDINNNLIATLPLHFFNHTVSSIIKGEEIHYKIPILTIQHADIVTGNNSSFYH